MAEENLKSGNTVDNRFEEFPDGDVMTNMLNDQITPVAFLEPALEYVQSNGLIDTSFMLEEMEYS